MSTSHAKVADKFVAGQPAKGSRLRSEISILGLRAISYNTAIARISQDRLHISPKWFSPSTGRHKDLILSAWGRKRVAAGYPYNSGVFHTLDIGHGASHDNVAFWVSAATTALAQVLNRRCRPHTRAMAFRSFHADVRKAADIFWLLPAASIPIAPDENLVSRLKAYTTLCAAIPEPEWNENGIAPMTQDDYMRTTPLRELEGI